MGYVIAGESKRIERENRLKANLAAYQVWRLAHLMRVKRLPRKPDDLMKAKKNTGSGADWKKQKAVVEMMNAAFGGFDNRDKGRKEEG